MAATVTLSTPPLVRAAFSALGEEKMPPVEGSLSVCASCDAAVLLAARIATEMRTLPGATVTTTSLVLTPAAFATTAAMAAVRAGV